MRCDEAVSSMLTQLRAIVPGADTDRIDELARRVDGQALRILVIGEAKRGKSTLVNALLGRPVLPTGVRPLTAVATTVRYGEVDEVAVLFRDGTRRKVPLGALEGLVTETGNPANRRGVAEVTVTVAAPLLAGGMELVDTPGIGSVHAHNTAEGLAALDRMDVAVFVLTADPPISASEREFLRQIRNKAVAVFCVLNKMDRLEPDERVEALRFTRKVVCDELGAGATIFPVSARAALAGRDADRGFAQFREAFIRYQHTAGPADLCRSVALHAAQLARSAAETQQAVLAALALSADDLAIRLGQLQVALDALEPRRVETAALADAEFARLRRDTDIQAAELASRVWPEIQRDVRERASTAAGNPAAVEAAVLAAAVHQIKQVVAQWHAARTAELGVAIAALDERLTARLSNDIRIVRDAAAQLFALRLPTLSSPEGLAPLAGFSYAFAPEPGQVDALAAALRHRLPSRLARRQIARYGDDRAEMLLDRHIGRARAAFQSGLDDTHRRFSREVDRRFDEGAGRLADAVRSVSELATTNQPRIDAARTHAATILAQARGLAERCEALARDRSGELRASR